MTMHRLLALVTASTLVALAVNGVMGGDQPELVLKPAGDTFTRPLDSALLLTCEVFNAVENVNYDVRWYSANDREITDKTGRRYVEEESLSMKKLYITRIVQDDGGKYVCKANIAGQQQQKTVQLQIFKDITFDNVPTPQHPKINTDALIHCVVSGQPAPEVTWRYGGKRIQFTNGSRYVLVAGQGMKITNITTADDGEYTCRAEVDAEGRYDERKISVKVHIPPKIVDDQLKVEGVEGTQATIFCRADGLPKPQYEFYKDGSSASVQASNSIKVDGVTGVVKFEPLSKADEGKYTCRAFNDVGNATASGQVRVLVKPLISEFNSLTAKEGSSVTLTCSSRGDPVPTMTFRKADGQLLKSDGRIDVTDDRKGKLQLTIKNLEPSDAANYTCRAENNLGHHETTSSIVVLYKPRFAANHSRTVYAWAGSARNISCHASGEPAPELTWLARDRVLANNDTYHIYNLGSTSHLLVKVRDIDQSWIYSNFICQAKSQLGEERITIELKRATVPGRPASLNVTKNMPTMLLLTVQRPEEDGGVPVVGFRVEYDQKMKFDIATDGKIRVENLKPSTNYTIIVRAKNDVGVGAPRELSIVTEDIRKPYPIVVSSPTQGKSPFSYRVEWEHPDNGGKPILQYEIRYRQVKKKFVNGSEVVEPATPDWTTINREDESSSPMIDFEFNGLLEAASYEVEIRARNDLGWSELNEKFTFTTSAATPEDLARASVMSVLSIGAVVGITIVVLIIILVIVDVSCYFVNSCGVTKILCTRLTGDTAAFNKEKAAEEGESKEALTNNQPLQEVVNAAEAMTDDGPKEQTEVPAGEDVDKKPLLIDDEQADDDVKKPDELKAEDGKDAGKEDAEQPSADPEKGATDKVTDGAETG